MFDFEQWNNYCNDYLAVKEEDYNSSDDFDEDLWEDFRNDQAEADRLEAQYELWCEVI